MSKFPLGFEGASLRPSKYLRFEQVEGPKRKTSVWNVHARSNDVLLGQIKWYPAWRQYCFFAEPSTIFNLDCLRVIQDRIETCGRWQRNIRENVKALERREADGRI